MRKRFMPALLASALIAGAVAAPTAHAAGQYTQFTCKLPDGSPAATDGWVKDDPAAFFTQSDDCAARLALRTQMASTGTGAGSQRSWTWTAPPNTSLDGVELYRAITLTTGDGSSAPTAVIASGSNIIESVVGSSAGTRLDWKDPTNRIATAPGGNTLRVGLGCSGPVGASCPNVSSTDSEVRLYAAKFTIGDHIAPTTANLAGSLTTGATKRGVEQLSFNASDAGAGIYKTIVTVDGAAVANTTPNTNGGRCVDAIPADSDPYQFQHQVPCPLNLSGVQVPIDTRTLSDGAHILEVEVEDAAGNRSTAFGPAMIAVDNTPPPPPASSPGNGQAAAQTPASATTTPATTPNGVGGSPSARLTVAVLESRQRLIHVAHNRSVTLSGRLVTQGGAPIPNAAVEIQARRADRGATMAPLATVRTDAAGGFRYVLRPGPSRLVRFGYRARLGDASFSSTAEVDVRVKAKLSFRVSHTRLRNGRTLTYSGRVAGQTRRPLIQIQVRSQGRWVNVCVVRARTNGAYSCRYRFRRTFSPTTYTFRALVRTQEGLPYDTAASPRRAVRVRP